MLQHGEPLKHYAKKPATKDLANVQRHKVDQLLPGAGENVNREWLLMGMGFPQCDEDVPELDSSDGCITL